MSFPKTLIIIAVGVTTKKKTIAITIGDTILPSSIPNLNQALFNWDKIGEFNKPKIRKITDKITDQILISLLSNNGNIPINKKMKKKIIPKLLLEPISIFFFCIQINNGCFIISSFLIPATLTGLFMASLLKGSPSSWLRITSINVVIPFF